MKKRKKYFKFIFILLLIIVILAILLNKLSSIRNSKESFEYIYSEEMDKQTVSPKMIHVILSLYQGEVNPKSISKSTYYFVNTVIPKYRRKCTSSEKSKNYFEKNKKDIFLDTGINHEDEFLKLTEEIGKLDNSKIESSRFDKENVQLKNNRLEAILYVCTKDGNEVPFKVTINNKLYENKSSIKYSVK